MALYSGTAVSPGMALGPAYCIPPESEGGGPALPSELASLPPLEGWKKLLKSTLQSLESAIHQLQARRHPQAELLEAQALILQDAALESSVAQRIAQGQPLLEAIAQTLQAWVALMESKSDAYMRSRSEDFQVLLRYLTRTWEGRPLLSPLMNLEKPSILVIHALTSDETSVMDPQKVLGIVSESGSRTSHGAIMARSLGIPALLGVDSATQIMQTGSWLFLDGERGMVETQLTPERLQACQNLCRQAQEAREKLQEWARRPARTRDGLAIAIRGNLAHTEEIKKAVEQGIEGVGLMRTEFLFMNRSQAPDEEEQLRAYQEVLKAFPGQKVVIRTIDIGGDKPIDYWPFEPEPNPCLGNRGIRYGLSHPETLKVQLRALLRASESGNLSIMLPMVNGPEEVRAVRAMVEEAVRTLRREGYPLHDLPALGVMVETPSAVINADRLAKEVDFFSIGTNDLTQYLCAADRLNPQISRFCDPLYPAVIRSLQHIIRCADEAKIAVSLCGEMGSDPRMLGLLVGLGLRELSMSPFMALRVKQRLAEIDLETVKVLTNRVLEAQTLEEVEALLDKQTG